MLVANNSSLRLHSPPLPGLSFESATVLPRLNGDDTVTLFTAFGDASGLLDPTPLRRGNTLPAATTVPAALPVCTVRFVPGQSVLILPRAGAPALLVTLQEVVSP
jgi:hypothetical protein